MKKMFFWPVVFCGILAVLALSTEKAQAELGRYPHRWQFHSHRHRWQVGQPERF